ncbi:nuclear transport factor 2 family protein [Shewanella woodyi]|uniref:nuclear transport factor 2 family protein n=1 Tax=Shewanella woodyi TaxID=60961 RepID=UPI0007EB1883|nr:nuclear transport factor 2 family protein [Shewanella woodyi]
MTKSRKIANAKGLYLEGIRDGNMIEALDKYTGERYTQHSTGVGDGKEGFMEFFAPFLERNPKRDIQVVRAIEDGQYVFVHVYQSLNDGEAKWVTADLFDTDDNDRMIEHWDVIAAFEEKTLSGRTMVDGPTEVEDLDKTDENKTIVQAFFDDVLLGRKFDKATKYISSKQYDQHNPEVGDGLVGVIKHFETKKCEKNSRYVKLHHLIGQGNFVVTFSHTLVSGEDWAFFDIFRLKDSMIVEHWDVQEKILSPEQWNNSGKF